MQRGEGVSLFLCLILSFSAQVLAQCYHFDGSRVNSTNYVPCNSQVGVASMCCSKNTSSNADECLPNGLCRNYIENSHGNGFNTLLWRESCTDQTWKSPFCLNLCTAGSGKFGGTERVQSELAECALIVRFVGVVIGEFRNYSQDDVLVIQCPDQSYCCGESNMTCCNQGHGTRIANIIGQTLSTSSITSSTSSAAISSSSSVSTTSPSPSASPTPTTSPLLSPGAKIGIGVGVSVGAILAVLIGGGIWYLARKKARTRRVETENSYAPVDTQGSPKVCAQL